MNDYTIYDATIEVLSPLHIGNGHNLLLDYDYAVHDGKTWRLNESAFLDMQDVDDPKLMNELLKYPPAQFLKEENYRSGSSLFHYVLNGAPRSQAAGAQLAEYIKDAWHQPYLPGASLKGALRTAILHYGLGALNIKVDKRDLRPKAKFAALDLEHRIAGKDPNHDLFKALQVSDSKPIAVDKLMLVNAKVVTKNPSGSPIELEAIEDGTILKHTIKIDNALFSDWASSLGFKDKKEWLQKFRTLVYNFSLQRIRKEEEWFKSQSGGNHVAEFYAALHQIAEENKAVLLQIGWGGGWDSKTFGSHLRKDPRLMEGIIADYKLNHNRPRRPGDPFPKSRRMMMIVNRDAQGRLLEVMVRPLGWVRLRVKQRE